MPDYYYYNDNPVGKGTYDSVKSAHSSWTLTSSGNGTLPAGACDRCPAVFVSRSRCLVALAAYSGSWHIDEDSLCDYGICSGLPYCNYKAREIIQATPNRDTTRPIEEWSYGSVYAQGLMCNHSFPNGVWIPRVKLRYYIWVEQGSAEDKDVDCY